MESVNELHQVKKLEKEIRILKKKLDRSEAERHQVEDARERSESILKGVIREFEKSQTALEKRSHELETTLEDLKFLQVKLIESEKMSALGVLVAGIAHEINNPVSFIYGNLNHAKDYCQDLLKLIVLYQRNYPEPVAEIKAEIEAVELEFVKQDLGKLFQSMYNGAERISQIIKSLRTFSRLDEATFKLVDIHEGIDSTLLILNHRLKATANNPNGIQLIRQYEELPLIECYPSQLNQVFLNILSNAIETLEEASQARNQEISECTILIRTYKASEDQIIISITDNGLGIPDIIRPKLFEPFFTTKPVGKSTGLGLSISYQIVAELHHGKLDYNSAVGKGTEFVVALPIKANLMA